MEKYSHTNRFLIGISLVSTFLVFVLSTIFWLDAYKQRRNAVQLQASVVPEITLLELSSSLAQERSLHHTILAEASPTEAQIDDLKDAKLTSSKLLNQAFEEIRESRRTNSFFISHRYGDSAIDRSISELSDSIKRIRLIGSVIRFQLQKHPSERNELIRTKIFDAYDNIINQVNNLRQRTQFLPLENNRQMVDLNELKNAIWKLNETVLQNSSLLESYLIKKDNQSDTKIDIEGLLYRVYQQSQSADYAMFELNEFIADHENSQFINSRLNNLTEEFTLNYRTLENSLIDKISDQSAKALEIDVWQKTYIDIQSVIQSLSTDTTEYALQEAIDIEKSSTLTLALDTILVLFCIGMAIASNRITKRVQHHATHDDLTKLPNRRYFSTYLGDEIKKHTNSNDKIALLTIDLNRFKSVNDTMGHAVGDSLLIQVAKRLAGFSSESALVSRMGGDEFSLLLSTGSSTDASTFAERILHIIDTPFEIDGSTVSIGASIGISFFPQDATTQDQLQVTSDHAMFFAKSLSQKEGESRLQVYTKDMAQKLESRLQIERDLAIAIQDNQLELYYQPQFSLKQNKVIGVEALVRWNHPEKGFVSPIDFIDVAEQCGLMPSLGRWVLKESCRQCAEWRFSSNQELRVAINVSLQQIMQKGFVDEVLDTLSSHRLPGDAIEIELTESLFMTDSDWVVSSLTQLRDAGIEIALDDFGTGYSSFSQLQELPINTLKIDRTFISRLEGGDQSISQSVTSAIASVAVSLGLDTVAEGVETDEQLQVVEKLGIDIIQGYYYSKPLPGKDVLQKVQSINEQENQFKKAA